ncbi:MAG: TonB-dependent receptor [Thiohalomonadales bacterium]
MSQETCCIEILRGSQSVLWGSDAIGGVIAITTRRGRSGENRVMLAVQEGSFNSSESAATQSVRKLGLYRPFPDRFEASFLSVVVAMSYVMD